MELETSEPAYPASGGGDWQIPIDLFGSKKHAGVPRGVLAFADASGNIVYRVNRHPSNPDPYQQDKKLLLDSSGNTLFSIYRNHSGSWKCYKGNSNVETELVLRVQRTLKKLNRVELDVFFGGERAMDEACDLRVSGSPFRRSCSIYKDTELVAQILLTWSELLPPELSGRGPVDPVVLFSGS